MGEAWYGVAGMAFSYGASAVLLIVLLLAFRQDREDRKRWRKVHAEAPGVGSACSFRVRAIDGRWRAVGEQIPVPYEGTLGASPICDVCIPVRKVHARSAFFWMERGALHMVPLHRDGFVVDGVRAEAGDEAILRHGAELRLGSLSLILRMPEAGAHGSEPESEPYVTRARAQRASRGKAGVVPDFGAKKGAKRAAGKKTTRGKASEKDKAKEGARGKKQTGGAGKATRGAKRPSAGG